MKMVEFENTPMIRVLNAGGPHSDYVSSLMLFGQFVGVWDMDVKFFNESGETIFHSPGEWSFGWVLDGRAVQDVLIYGDMDHNDLSPSHRAIGSSLRYYDERRNSWRVVWLGARSGILAFLEGGAVGDEIHLRGHDDSEHWIWMFKEITTSSFRWQGEVSLDGGKSWRTEQEMLATRRS